MKKKSPDRTALSTVVMIKNAYDKALQGPMATAGSRARETELRLATSIFRASLKQ